MKDIKEIRDRITGLQNKYGMNTGFLNVFGRIYYVVFSDHEKTEKGMMEHVSVSCLDHKHTPTWKEMCEVKDIFFKDEEEAYQIHPKKSEYVNLKSNCLHLWRKADE